MKQQTANRFFDIAFAVLFCILIVGTPLVFTSLTRSVFEVNKLLLLRLFLLVASGLWLFKTVLFKDNGVEEPENTFNIFGFKWKKTGIEIPAILWMISNILSTVFSTNLTVSIIGAYDRWEGIITVTNYLVLILIFAKLLTKRFQLKAMLTGLALATIGSAIYGVLQSLGIDFMRWSVDPTQRVFACINNPVHYCAFMGMTIPALIGWHLKVCKDKDGIKSELIKWALFASTSVIYYTMYLSYSRATWLGFVGSMPLLYFLAHGLFFKRSKNIFIGDILFTLVAIATFFLTAIFRLNQLGIFFGVPTYIIVSSYLIYVWYNNKVEHKKDSRKLDILTIPLILGIALFNFLLPLEIFKAFTFTGAGIKIILAAIIIIATLKSSANTKHLLARVAIVLIFTKLQFVTTFIFAIMDYFTILLLFLAATQFSERTYNGDESIEELRGQREGRFWLNAYLVMFAVVIIIPSFSNLATDFGSRNVEGLPAASSVRNKIDTYQRDAIKGTARTSMWKSSIPWIKDYWLLGSGLDTIKYQYPNYRRPEYGRLEGGHNFTPDRLHNEYLNTLASKGIVGFVTYYLIFILSWFLICIGGLYKFIKKNNPYQFILVGSMIGCLVYLGQVLFNFGVVATLVLFYILLGSGIAISNEKDFDYEQK